MKVHGGGRMTCFVSRDPSLSRGRFLATHPGQLVDHQEGPHWLNRVRLDEIWDEFSKREGLGEADKRKMEELCSQGLVSCVNLGWSIPNLQGQSCDISELQASDLKASSLDASDLEASGLDASDLEASGLDASDLEASGLQASSLDASSLDASDLNASSLEASSLDALDLEASGLQASSLDDSSLEASGLDASDLEASDLNASSLYASSLEASGSSATGWLTSGLKAPGRGIAGMKAPGRGIAGMEAPGRGIAGMEAPGWGIAGMEAPGWGCPDLSFSKPLRLNLIALGDVGSTVLMGLKLLAGERIEEIGIWDMNPNQMKRWEFEMNQTAWAWEYKRLPVVRIIEREELFDCDVLVFCASKGVPTVEPASDPRGGETPGSGDGKTPGSGDGKTPGSGDGKTFGSESGRAAAPNDVRMAQYEANRELIRSFGREARKVGFTGLFAVVSDPVDPLCRALFYASNQNENGDFDQAGLKPEQIQGYGLGVMNARAAYFAKIHSQFASFLEEGRAFGPHGQDLVIANSISRYDDQLSRELTRLAAEANLTMRDMGFKPYVAPALSSAVIPLIQTVSGQWHYSSYFLGGVFMGSKNRLTAGGIETEDLPLPPQLELRIQTAYDRLKAIEP